MIAFINEDGNVSTCTLRSSVPEGTRAYEVQAPQDKLFREAWTINNNDLEIDLDKAKDIVHVKRRTQRTLDFKPYDDIVSLGIPGEDTTAAEAARVVIRTADATLQIDIDACADEGALRTIITDNDI